MYFWPADFFDEPSWNCVPSNSIFGGCEEYCEPAYATDDVALFERNYGLDCNSDYYYSHNDTSFKGCDTHTTGIDAGGFLGSEATNDEDDDDKKNTASRVVAFAIAIGIVLIVVIAIATCLCTSSKNNEVAEKDQKIQGDDYTP